MDATHLVSKICDEIGTTGYTQWKQETNTCENGCNSDRNECNACSKNDEDKCENGKIISCDNGVWVEQACLLGCSNGKCNECQQGVVLCNSNDNSLLDVCEDGIWSHTHCEYGCDTETNSCFTCSKSSYHVECAENMINIKECVDGYIHERTCEHGCSNDVCNECSEKETQCNVDNHNAIDVCENGTWNKGKYECPLNLDCDDGLCKCDSDNWINKCDGDNLILCNQNEAVISPCKFGCINGACATSQCEKNATKCEIIEGGATLFHCDNSKWVEGGPCETKTCDIGREACGCKIGDVVEVECDGSNINKKT